MVLDRPFETHRATGDEVKKILITGLPGVGKTTLIRKLCDDLASYHPVGFYTSEIRTRGARRGFELIGLHGEKSILARVDSRSEFRVGKYGVEVPAFEDFLRSIPFDAYPVGPVVIDEIGKMECFSTRFRVLVDDFMRADRVVVATIAEKSGGFIASVKHNPSAVLHRISVSTRDAVYVEVRDAVLSALRGGCVGREGA
jgi:nucleoside-triphosphatase